MAGFDLGCVTTGARALPARLFLHASEKWGKTSVAAHAPAPVFLMSRGENGLESLIASGQLPPTPHFPEVLYWRDLLRALEALDAEHPYRTLVLDTVNGFAQLCCEHVCEEAFDGAWPAFHSYGAGYKTAQPEWERFLRALDRLHSRRRMAVVALCHTVVKGRRDPGGVEIDHYQPDFPDKLWGPMHRWCDVILFGRFRAAGTGRAGKRDSKAVPVRVLVTGKDLTCVSGNRFGLPPEIPCGDGPARAWANLQAALARARKQAAPDRAPAPAPAGGEGVNPFVPPEEYEGDHTLDLPPREPGED